VAASRVRLCMGILPVMGCRLLQARRGIKPGKDSDPS
jgi:hypothetical protein